MDIQISEAGNVVFVELSGYFLKEDGAQFEQQIAKLIDQGHVKIVLSMTNVSSLDSQGLSQIISARKKARKEGGNLKLACMQHSIKELFELARMHKVFEIFDTNQDAAASFGS